ITGGMILETVGRLILQLGVGAIAGIVIGYITVWIVNRIHAGNEFLYPVLVIACCFFAFTLTNLVGGNSYLAVYISGVVVGNNKIVLKRTIATFFGGFSWLVQIVMFLTLGLLVNPHELLQIAVPGIMLGVFMIFIARPAAVYLCLAPFRRYTFKAKTYIGWVGLRGAVPIIFATYALMSPAVGQARFMFNIVFFITILSLLIQGTTVTRMARWLGLTEEVEPRHFSGFELPEEVTAASREQAVTAELLTEGSTLSEITLPPETLVILVKRGDAYLVPKGNTRLYIGDVLLLISRKAEYLKEMVK
ncbi:MAG: cation:proton antiporter, partial [Muribaculaceae bacterium]